MLHVKMAITLNDTEGLLYAVRPAGKVTFLCKGLRKMREAAKLVGNLMARGVDFSACKLKFDSFLEREPERGKRYSPDEVLVFDGLSAVECGVIVSTHFPAMLCGYGPMVVIRMELASPGHLDKETRLVSFLKCKEFQVSIVPDCEHCNPSPDWPGLRQNWAYNKRSSSARRSCWVAWRACWGAFVHNDEQRVLLLRFHVAYGPSEADATAGILSAVRNVESVNFYSFRGQRHKESAKKRWLEMVASTNDVAVKRLCVWNAGRH